MLYHLFIALFGILFLMGVWFFVQALERRQKMLRGSDECDVLKGRMGCLGCLLKGHCKKVGEDSQ